MGSKAAAGLLLGILWLLAWAGSSHAAATGQLPDLSGIWWAVESFTYADGRRERWEYVVGIGLDGDRLTISDGDGMSLAGTLVNGTGVLRGSYPWNDGTLGDYTLTVQVRDAGLLEAAGSCVDRDAAGRPVPQAPGLVSLVLTRLGDPELQLREVY